MSLYAPTTEEYLEEIEKFNWSDPNPKPIVERVGDYFVVRDDLLGYGTKARFIDCLIKNFGNEWVFGGAPKTGWGPISLAYVCGLYGKKATIFGAKRAILTPQQQKAIDFGANYIWLNMGMLTVTTAKARQYWEEDKKNRMILPLGLEHPSVFGSIIKVARENINENDISEIWTVGSSGTLSRGLQMAFPKTPVNLVQVGHKLNEREIGRAKLYISPYKWDQPTKNPPPYPSEIYYDAKVWEFVEKFAKPNALIWNVA